MEASREDAIEAMESAIRALAVAVAKLRGITIQEYAEQVIAEYVAERIVSD